MISNQNWPTPYAWFFLLKCYRSFKAPSFLNTIFWNRNDYSKPLPDWWNKILSYSKKKVIETEEMISTCTDDLAQQWSKLKKLTEKIVLYGQVISLTIAQGPFESFEKAYSLDKAVFTIFSYVLVEHIFQTDRRNRISIWVCDTLCNRSWWMVLSRKSSWMKLLFNIYNGTAL